MIWHPAYLETYLRELFLKNSCGEIEPAEVRHLVRARMALPPFHDQVIRLVVFERRGWAEIAELCDTYPAYVKRVYYRAMRIVFWSVRRQERKGW